jgi:hypothetical protein
MCLYPSDQTEPQNPKECWMNNRGDMMIPIKDILAKEKGCTVRISTIGNLQNSSVQYVFNILLTTQLSETIISSGVWNTQLGKFVHKKYTGYFNASAETVSLFIQSKFKRVSGNVWLIPLENFDINRLPGRAVQYNGQQSVITFPKSTIQQFCDPAKHTVVSYRVIPLVRSVLWCEY